MAYSSDITSRLGDPLRQNFVVEFGQRRGLGPWRHDALAQGALQANVGWTDLQKETPHANLATRIIELY